MNVSISQQSNLIILYFQVSLRWYDKDDDDALAYEYDEVYVDDDGDDINAHGDDYHDTDDDNDDDDYKVAIRVDLCGK